MTAPSTFAADVAPRGVSLRDRYSRAKNAVMFAVCVGFTGIILALLVLVVAYLVVAGFGSLHLSFFTRDPIPPGMDGAPGGMRQAVVGTIIMIGLACAVGLPAGMLCGIYLAEYEANAWLATPVRFISDVLAGVPSIVVGILGYELLVVPMGHNSGWAGALALAFIMIPIVARTTEEMLRLVPNSYREAAIALGATKARTILGVVIPSATGSVITGIMLAIARVAGETAPLLFTALGSRLLTCDPKLPFPALTLQIWEDVKSPNRDEQHLAQAGILVLIVMIFALNLAVRYFTRTRTRTHR